MEIFRDRRVLALLFLLLIGTISTAMIVPFMPYYIVEGLGEEPWRISLYSGLAILLAVVFNRHAGKMLDEGARFLPLIVAPAIAYLVASIVLYLFPNYWILLVFGALGFSLSATFMAVMFTFGRTYADEASIDGARFNAFLRATTSTAWMIGPAVSFSLVDLVGVQQVFLAAIGLGLIRLVITVMVVPRDLTGSSGATQADELMGASFNLPLWKAVAACFFLSTAHSLCFSALPLFYTLEVGLPEFAPGFAFSVKTATEIMVIAATPYMMRRFSKRNILLGASALALVAIFALSRVSSLPMLVGAEVLEGAYYGIYASVGVSFVQSFARGRMGYATSLYVNTIMISGVLAGPIVGLMGQFFSFQMAIEVSITFVLLAMLVFYTVKASEETAPA